MSNQIKPVLVQDPLLALDDKIAYAVFRGGANVSTQKFNATSSSSTSHIYNIQVPSTSTVMSRQLVWGSDITFTIQGNTTVGKYLLNYPVDTVLAPFPLNQLTSNASIQINNTTVQLPVNQVLDVLLRNLAKDQINRWNSSTPTQLDYFGDYNQIAGGEFTNMVASPFNGAFQTLDRRDPPRGAFPVTITGNTIGVADESLARTVTLTVSVREPVFVSPFIFGDGEGQAGLTGITQINANFQMDAAASRAIRWLLDADIPVKSITNVSYNNSFIECKFLSPKPSDLIPQTVITPLATYTNYVLPASSNALSYVGNADGPNGSALISTDVLTSNSIMLNSYPDKVFVYVRNRQNSLNNATPDVYATIDNISITLGAQSGLLSNMLPIDLYRASYEAGSQQTYTDFVGVALGTSADSSIGLPVVTSGSVLCLDFGRHIEIQQDYFAPGSLSTTQFQIQVRFTNNTGGDIYPELNVMFMQSGILSTSNGSSSAYTSGVLSKQVVLDANLQEPVQPHELNRLVGGAGLLHGFKAFASKMLPRLPSIAKHVLGAVDHPVTKEAEKVLGHMGYGVTGGAETGGKRGLKHRVY
jgi:hypothetical protein